MFDAFIVEIEDKTIELQTKRFECVLYHYRVGDVVDGAPRGVQVYLDTTGTTCADVSTMPAVPFMRRSVCVKNLSYSLQPFLHVASTTQIKSTTPLFFNN